MSKVKVDEIESSSGGGLTAKIANNLSNRNLIINGAMDIAQRSQSSTDDGVKTVDRFICYTGGDDEAPTQSQHALTSSDTGPWEKGFRYSFRVTNGNQTSGADASDYTYLSYVVEAQDIATSGWDYTSASSKITLSFWVKSSVAGQQYAEIYIADGTAQSYCFSVGNLSANTWTKVTHTIPGNSNITINNDNGGGLYIYWGPYWGTTYTTPGHTLNTWAAYSATSRTPDQPTTWWTTNDATFEISGVQLEVSDYATEFEHRSYADELRRCQRYFERVGGELGYDAIANGMQRTTSQSLFQLSFKVPKRAAPTVTLTGDVITTDRYAFDETITGLDAAIASKTGLHGRATHSSVGAERRPIFLSSKNGTPYGYISFDAEL